MAEGFGNVNLVLAMTSLKGNVFLSVLLTTVGGEFMCLCVCSAGRVEQMLFLL